MTGSGGYWSARIVGGMRQIIGVEAAYVGNARTIDALGLNGNARLISNGLEGALRLNIPIVSWNQMSLVEPFGFVGLGWAHYNLTNINLNTSNVASSDDIMTHAVRRRPRVRVRRLHGRRALHLSQDLLQQPRDRRRGPGQLGAGGQIGFGF